MWLIISYDGNDYLHLLRSPGCDVVSNPARFAGHADHNSPSKGIHGIADRDPAIISRIRLTNAHLYSPKSRESRTVPSDN